VNTQYPSSADATLDIGTPLGDAGQDHARCACGCDCGCGCGCAHASASQSPHRRLMRHMRLVGRLLRQEAAQTRHPDLPLTVGEARAATQAIDARLTTAVSEADLMTTLTTLDLIAEAFGGADALLVSPRNHRDNEPGQAGAGRGRRHGRGRGFGSDPSARREHGGHRGRRW
jgi:hypothetical protein